jgi:acyl-CoA reductase-like NAD-dependent aldehyde dehydrogenase
MTSSPLWFDPQLLIDGKLVDSSGGRTFTSANPATEEVIGSAPDATVADAGTAIEAARVAFDTTDWATDRKLRARCLDQLVQALDRHREEMRALTVAEVGVPVSLTQGPALEAAVKILAFYAELADSYDGTVDLGVVDTQAGPAHRWVEREPYGVVAAISAYNYPNQLNLAKLGPALAAGCTVVLKGAPATPLVTLALGHLISEETDFPPGVVNILASSEADVGVAMTTDPRVDMISFTGSTPVGRTIMSAASDTLKKCFLELGGKSASLVLDEESVEIASLFCSFAACSHAGQGCAITSRLVVPREHLDLAVATVKSTFEGFKVGDPTDPTNYLGPLISAEQQAKVQGMVDRAVEEGATIVTGGRPPEGLEGGHFFAPTLIVGAAEDSEIAREEVFGPVLVVLPHDGDDDAVRIANDSPYGLSGAVTSTDRERSLAVARRIRSGTLSVDGGMYYAPDAPFGGYKQSGFGREMGVAGLEEFLQTKTLAEPAPPS